MSKTVHVFANSMITGQQGEAEIRNYLLSRGNVAQVIDVSDNPAYQEKDIDFLVYQTSGALTKTELKTDTYDKNFFYETLSNIERGTPGCMEKTEADCLCYYYVNLDTLYVIDLPALRKWFHSIKQESWVKRKTLTNAVGKGHFYTSEGYVFSRQDFEEKFPGYWYKVENLSEYSYAA